ncbi:MAG: chemotaxis response regulator protein-glutamate methylesterase [Opitutales bacterium TMED158]|nr:MAG: chemotaxis response regulator protein-glutamate methylesterase [Opitutales bacterium TMED158]
MPKIRVLVVDDAVVIRRMVSEVLDADPNFEVVGVASNGKIAVQKVTQVNPDAITLDVEMPEMNGLETVKAIRKTHPKLPIIMFSTLTEKGGWATLEALSEGANDYVTKPANVGNVTEGLERLKKDMIPKLKAQCPHLVQSPSASRSLFANSGKSSAGRSRLPLTTRPDILCIGTSTGGPNALADLVQDLPVKLKIPVVLVQHMPPTFTLLLAERLNKLSPNKCVEARHGMPLENGCIYLAPGDKHMVVVREGVSTRVELNEDPPENSCRPAVDVLFRSVSEIYGPKTLGVILTGMGKDGLNGSEAIVENGGSVVAQDEESSVVWGMPGYVAEAGLAEKLLPLNEVGDYLLKRMGLYSAV